MIDIQLLETPLSVEQCVQLVEDGTTGGTAVFIGTVRNSTQSKAVERLDFEAYAPVAIKEMRKIAEQMVEKFGALECVIHHRTGSLDIKEIAVIIAVATPHRKAAFEACQFGIDQLKETVPIWKKEVFEDGEIWVAAHP